PELVQFAQRVASDFHLVPLSKEDVQEYINHRLEVAGRKSILFTELACERIFKASRGIPRIINVLSDTSLVYGFAQMAEQIDSAIVDEVIADKKEHGVFKLEEDTAPAAAPAFEAKPALPENDEPALIIRDKDLAKLLLSKLQN
ncbi:MAG: hypothetical protein ABJN51_02345, partial [Sneathiella sp.]